MHRDIRFPNFLFTKQRETYDDELRNGKGEFCIIDYDTSDKIGEKVKKRLNHYPEWIVEDYEYRVQDDIYLLGMLIDIFKRSSPKLPPVFGNLAQRMMVRPDHIPQTNNAFTSMDQILEALRDIKI